MVREECQTGASEYLKDADNLLGECVGEYASKLEQKTEALAHFPATAMALLLLTVEKLLRGAERTNRTLEVLLDQLITGREVG